MKNFWKYILKEGFSARVVFCALFMLVLCCAIYFVAFYYHTGLLLLLLLIPSIITPLIAYFASVHCAINTVIFNFIALVPYVLSFITSSEKMLEKNAITLSNNPYLLKSAVMINIFGFLAYIFLSKVVNFFFLQGIKKKKFIYSKKLNKISEEWNIKIDIPRE